MPQTIAFTVNGRAVNVIVPHDDTPLLDVLRNHLGLTGTRFGCGLEQCGCCIVLIDGKPVKSCGRSVASIAGCSVTTIEGLGSPEKPHPLQQAFVEEQAGQCGYCLSGILISARRCSTAIHRRRGRKSPAPSTIIFAAAVRITGFCAPSKKPRPACAKAPAHDATPMTLPSVLADNPRLNRWLNFAAPGKVELATGRVELGQGVLTAMTQIAAEELDVAFERITIRSGDTDRTPNEGYTAASQSMQAGGIALRAACAETRALAPWLRRDGTLGSRRPHPAQRCSDAV
jgi:nicotinate dehydrogenase subunit B